MKNENFTYSFHTSKTAEEVFNLLLHIEQWWSGIYEETISGSSQEPGDEFSFKAGGGAHYTKQKLASLVPGKEITWLVTESNLSFVDTTDEWTGTKLHFKLEPAGDKTLVSFTHEGLTPAFECYESCSQGWTAYLNQLKNKLQ